MESFDYDTLKWRVQMSWENLERDPLTPRLIASNRFQLMGVVRSGGASRHACRLGRQAGAPPSSSWTAQPVRVYREHLLHSGVFQHPTTAHHHCWRKRQLHSEAQ